MKPSACILRLLSSWDQLWYAPTDRQRLGAFRVTLVLSMFPYFLYNWSHAIEWLTPSGFHPRCELLHPLRCPFPVPLLDQSLLPFFAVIFFGSQLALLFGWKLRVSALVAFLSAYYVTRVDHHAAFSPNHVYVVTLFVFTIAAWQPPIGTSLSGERKLYAAWPERVLQATLLVFYFSCGMVKLIYGDWLDQPHLLRIFADGIYRTSAALVLIQNVSLGWWSAAQYFALAVELALPILFLVRKLRPIAFTLGLIFHLSIGILLSGLMYFSVELIAFYVLFLDASTISRVGSYFRKR